MDLRRTQQTLAGLQLTHLAGVDDQAHMGQRCEMTAPLAVRRPASDFDWGQPDIPGPRPSRFVVQRDPVHPAPDGGPVFRCGHCLTPLPDVEMDPALRCPSCRRRNAPPGGYWIGCDRCGFEQRVRSRQLRAGPRCVNCGQLLSIEELVLTALHRRHKRPARAHQSHNRRRSGRPSSGRRDQAILVVLMFAAAVLFSLQLLSQL